MFQKQNNFLNNTATGAGEIRLLKTADLNFEGNKLFSSNYLCSGKFCQYA